MTKIKRAEITAADINIGDASERITILMKTGMVDKYRELANSKGIGYQTLIKQVLMDAITRPENAPLEKRLSTLEKTMLKLQALYATQGFVSLRGAKNLNKLKGARARATPTMVGHGYKPKTREINVRVHQNAKKTK